MGLPTFPGRECIKVQIGVEVVKVFLETRVVENLGSDRHGLWVRGGMEGDREFEDAMITESIGAGQFRLDKNLDRGLDGEPSMGGDGREVSVNLVQEHPRSRIVSRVRGKDFDQVGKNVSPGIGMGGIAIVPYMWKGLLCWIFDRGARKVRRFQVEVADEPHR